MGGIPTWVIRWINPSQSDCPKINEVEREGQSRREVIVARLLFFRHPCRSSLSCRPLSLKNSQSSVETHSMTIWVWCKTWYIKVCGVIRNKITSPDLLSKLEIDSTGNFHACTIKHLASSKTGKIRHDKQGKQEVVLLLPCFVSQQSYTSCDLQLFTWNCVSL